MEIDAVLEIWRRYQIDVILRVKEELQSPQDLLQYAEARLDCIFLVNL